MESSTKVRDTYTEPITKQFFRKDKNGFWYDIEGHRLATPIFLQGDILISLLGKTSKQSLSFQEQEVLASPNFELIQVGKLVFDIHLKLVDFYGEKITGLGRKCIVFSDEKSVQEIQLGLEQKRFLEEKTTQPFLINNEVVTQHLETIRKGKNRFEVFQTQQNTYVLAVPSAEPITCDGKLVSIDFSTYVSFAEKELVQCTYGTESKIMEVEFGCTFHLPLLEEEPIVFMDSEVIRVNGTELKNMATAKKQFVYNCLTNDFFSLNDKTIFPEKIMVLENFEKDFAIAYLNNTPTIFSKKTQTTLDFIDKTIRLQNIFSLPNEPLWNALDTAGRKIVIDARQGFDQLKIAKAEEQTVVEVLGEPEKVGNSFLQNAILKTLGGTEKRVVDLSKKDLTIYTLPADLKAYPESQDHSVFSNSPIHELDFNNTITIHEEEFIVGKFIPFREDFSSVIIQRKNNRPLHLEGGGHKNELVIGFDKATLQKEYFLGEHQIMGAKTLTEDYQEKELLFSFQEKKSWLKFGEDYLPVLKNIVEIEKATEWEYLLLEVRDIFSKPEFIAVEKNPPYRIVVEKKRRKVVPKIFKGSDKLPKIPKEVSLLRRLFLNDPGYLKEF